MDYGVECLVTPPSLIPQEYGNRVKTDRKDSGKLAYLLAKGDLPPIIVPIPKLELPAYRGLGEIAV